MVVSEKETDVLGERRSMMRKVCVLLQSLFLHLSTSLSPSVPYTGAKPTPSLSACPWSPVALLPSFHMTSSLLMCCGNATDVSCTLCSIYYVFLVSRSTYTQFFSVTICTVFCPRLGVYGCGGLTVGLGLCHFISVSYTHLTLPTRIYPCRSRWSPYH